MESATFQMATASNVSVVDKDHSYEERIMFYNISSDLTENRSSYDEIVLSWTSILYTTNIPFNSTFEEVTVLATLGRSPVRRGLPLTAMQHLLKNVDAVIMPAALSIGIVGNVLLVLIFIFTPLCASALSHYLSALGISDFIYLMSCLAVWITGRGINFHNTMGVCQITMFALLLSRFVATWYLFAAHAERMVVHFGSCRIRKWCSTFRTKCIIITIFVFSLVGFSHYIWTHVVVEKNGRNDCHIMQESLKHLIELGKIEIIAAVFLPMLLIIIIDISLVVRMAAKWLKKISSSVKSQKEMDSKFRGEYALAVKEISRSPSTRSGDSTPPPPVFDMSLEKVRATAAVVVAGLIFIGLILLSSIYRAKNAFSALSRPSENEIQNMILSEEIVKFNSVYKIFLYLLVLKSFRHGFVHFFKHGFRKPNEEESLQETTV